MLAQSYVIKIVLKKINLAAILAQNKKYIKCKSRK